MHGGKDFLPVWKGETVADTGRRVLERVQASVAWTAVMASVREPGALCVAAVEGILVGFGGSRGRLEHANCTGNLRGDHLDRREPSFGSADSRSNSTARRITANSVSSCATRRRAAVSSAFSLLVLPGQAAVDPVLPSPHVYRLLADPEVVCGDRPTGLTRPGQDLAADLRRLTPSPQLGLLCSRQPENPTSRLHQSRGRPLCL